MTHPNTFSRWEIKKIFASHRGTQAALVRELGIAQPTMSLWLKGKFDSARINEACQRRASELSVSGPHRENQYMEES